jgi:hypothetical protein
MDDTEKIVLYFFLHKCESARAREIQRWTRFPGSRIMSAFIRCENTVFGLRMHPDSDEGLEVTLIHGPETARILKKYRDIIGIQRDPNQNPEP